MDRLTNEEIGIIINLLSQVRVTIAEADILKNIVNKLRSMAIDNQNIIVQDNNM